MPQNHSRRAALAWFVIAQFLYAGLGNATIGLALMTTCVLIGSRALLGNPTGNYAEARTSGARAAE